MLRPDAEIRIAKNLLENENWLCWYDQYHAKLYEDLASISQYGSSSFLV